MNRLPCRLLFFSLLLSPPLSAQSGPGVSLPADAANRGPSTEDRGLDVATRLERARSFYQAGRYAECAQAYEQLFVTPQTLTDHVSARQVEQARLYFATCLLAKGDEPSADAQLRAAMGANPLMSAPDPVVFPARVTELFFKVKSDFLEQVRRAQEDKLREAEAKAKLEAEIVRAEQLRVRQLERIARTETVVAANRRWIAALPFGIGQFQNDDPGLGTVFLTSEAILLGVSIFAVSRELSLHAEADGGNGVSDPDEINGIIRFAHDAGLFAGAGFLLVAGVGILEAQLNFVPEFPLRTRARPLPKEVRPAPPRGQQSALPQPLVVPINGGGLLGVSGRF